MLELTLMMDTIQLLQEERDSILLYHSPLICLDTFPLGFPHGLSRGPHQGCGSGPCGVVFLLNLARFDAAWQRSQLSFDPSDQARCRAFAFVPVVVIGFDTALRLCRWWRQNVSCGCPPRGLQVTKSGEYR